MALDILNGPLALGLWGVLVALSLSVLAQDLRSKNMPLVPMMKLVWVLTTLFSGPLGLAIYYYAGRAQNGADSIWKRGFRSVCHCYSGCGTGEIIGVMVLIGILAIKNNLLVATGTFVLAYVVGFATTILPLMQEGVGFRDAFMDAFLSDSATIAAMEIAAISTDLYLGAGATLTDVRFWSSLIISLNVGLIVAYPFNVMLVQFGVKKKMSSPHEGHH
ncbi:MAG TPA: DUF4396 domain-containing protein [Candidatus Diapherotrites archaeon]|uniref:DUF4396 domain-containing protein n=1 Tax=Candidatus Iainarchaeum sp. TaxID=3101447 RepID=A0A7J4J1U6_9ARCH|nr:DUF4396 domain-containing protein [Candidatus Diapherotrites archaeon]